MDRDILVRNDLDSVAHMTEATLRAWGIPFCYLRDSSDLTPDREGLRTGPGRTRDPWPSSSTPPSDLERARHPLLTKDQLLRPLAALRTNEVVVTCMSVTRPWGRLSDHDLDFASADSAMGHTADLALGIALAQPSRKVICLNGDGSMLMNLGTLVTIAGSRREEPDPFRPGERNLRDHREPTRSGGGASGFSGPGPGRWFSQGLFVQPGRGVRGYPPRDPGAPRAQSSWASGWSRARKGPSAEAAGRSPDTCKARWPHSSAEFRKAITGS